MHRSMAVLFSAGTMLAARGRVQDFAKTYERYEESYRQRHPYVIHAVNRDGFTLHAREFVPAAGGPSGPSIILMHGFPDNLHLYDLHA